MSWIHVDDDVAQVLTILNNASMQGAYNLTAPHPVCNAEFTATLASVVHRPVWLFFPDAWLRFVMGERAALLLDGQRVFPRKLQVSGVTFKFDSLDKALNNLLN